MRWLSLFLTLFLAVPVFANPAAAIGAALADARTLGPAAVRTRYLDLSPIPADYRAEVVKVLAFHVNQLSRESYLVPPRRVNETLLAVVLDDYRWDAKVWERLATFDPYYHLTVEMVKPWRGGVWRDGINYAAGSFRVKGKVAASAPWLPAKEIGELITLTQSQVPIVDAAWWFTQSARQLSLTNKSNGIGYYDWLAVQKRADFEKLVKFSERDSLEFGRELRAAIELSGVATQNRQVVRFQALGGGYYATLDTNDSTGQGNAIRNLARGDFKHQAEEIYGVLSNRLFAYFLGDDKGNRQDTAPDFIGPNDAPLRQGRDGRIHICLSCLECHTDGLRSIADFARKTLRSPLGLQSADYAKYVELRRAYFGNLEKQIEDDRKVFADALLEVNGFTTVENAKAFSKFWSWYALRLRGPPEIAAYMGITEERLLEGIKAYYKKTGYLDLPISGLLQTPPVPLRVEHLEELQPLLWQIVGAAK